FFFQAEDGVRDFHVTGVQTCALPISSISLPQAYWVWGVVGNLAISIVAVSLWGPYPPPLPMIAWLGYNVWVHLQIWYAAIAYKGLPLWKGLAQCIVLLGVALIVLGTINLLGDLLDRINHLHPEQGDVLFQIFWAQKD